MDVAASNILNDRGGVGDYLALLPGVSALIGRITRVCFEAGTQVIVGVDDNGGYVTRNIEDIREGAYVLAGDENDPDAPPTLKRVTQVFIKTTHELRVLSFVGADGATTTLNTTDEHPFFVVDRGWVRADELAIGDTLLQPDGTAATVTGSTVEVRAEGVTVYNLEVDGGHTYFVDDQTSGGAVWVHNANYYTGLVKTLKARGSTLIPKYRSNMTWRMRTLANGDEVIVIGQAGRSTSKTSGHAEAMYQFIATQAKKHDYAYFTVQRSWRTATGGVATRRNIPDIIGVRIDGTIDAWEVVSKTDKPSHLTAKLLSGRFSISAPGVPGLIDNITP